jgi:hypothetical protein
MAPRFRTSILFAGALLFLYLIFPFGLNDRSYQKANPGLDLSNWGKPVSGTTGEGVKSGSESGEIAPPLVHTKEKPKPTSSIGNRPANSASIASEVSTRSARSTSSATPQATSSPVGGSLTQQEQFDKEYDALGL